MNIKKVLILAIFTIAIIGIIVPINAANVADNVKRESKAKTVTYKITWNANNGKVGGKSTISTTVNKGTQIKKLPTTPKRTGYTFKGWYTKKTSGTKITKNTVPKKSATYYAYWTKGSTNTKSELVGQWSYMKIYGLSSYAYHTYLFRADGKFIYTISGKSGKTGNYKVSDGKITFTNIVYNDPSGEKKYPNTVAEYQLKKDSKGNDVLEISILDYPNKNYLPHKDFWAGFIKHKTT